MGSTRRIQAYIRVYPATTLYRNTSMRFLLALMVFFGVASGAHAQSPFADTTNVYVAPVFGYGYSSSGGSAVIGGLEAGVRLSDVVDVGFRAFGGDNGFGGTSPVLAFGPRVGLSAPIGPFEGYLGTSVTGVFAEGLADDSFGYQSVGLSSEATLGYSVNLGRTFSITPTVGAYGSVCSAREPSPNPDAQCAEVGALVGVDLNFKAFGTDVSIPLMIPIRLGGNMGDAGTGVFGLQSVPATAGIRVRF